MRNTLSTMLILLFALLVPVHAQSLIEVYKKGPIQFVADQSFGKDARWAETFLLLPSHPEATRKIGMIRQLAFADDFMLISVSQPFGIQKLDLSGRIVGPFGQGGDILYSAPLLAGIADDRVAVKNREGKLLLFDLAGRFLKSTSVDHPIVDALLLNKVKIATMAPVRSTPKRYMEPIAILDSETGKEVQIRTGFRPVARPESIEVETSNYAGEVTGRAVGGTSEGQVAVVLNPTVGTHHVFLSPAFSKSEWIMRRTADGNLLVGLSTEPELRVYGPDGRKLRTCRLQNAPPKITEQFKAEYLETTIEEVLRQLDIVKPNASESDRATFVKKVRELISRRDFFPEQWPYFDAVVVDSENNILVFLPSDKNGTYPFQVYSPDGQYVCDSAIDSGVFKIWLNGRSSDQAFHGDALYALVGNRDHFGGYRIIKVRLR